MTTRSEPSTSDYSILALRHSAIIVLAIKQPYRVSMAFALLWLPTEQE